MISKLPADSTCMIPVVSCWAELLLLQKPMKMLGMASKTERLFRL